MYAHAMDESLWNIEKRTLGYYMPRQYAYATSVCSYLYRLGYTLGSIGNVNYYLAAISSL